jgi:hypothetical protein
MEINDIVKDFFSNIKCTQCQNYFEKESINLVRHEYNYTVVRVTCSVCGKNIGMAILGLDKNSMHQSLEPIEEPKKSKTNKKAIKEDNPCDPITYDDVIDAHNFFYSLGEDWTKFLPEKE